MKNAYNTCGFYQLLLPHICNNICNKTPLLTD